VFKTRTWRNQYPNLILLVSCRKFTKSVILFFQIINGEDQDCVIEKYIDGRCFFEGDKSCGFRCGTKKVNLMDAKVRLVLGWSCLHIQEHRISRWFSWETRCFCELPRHYRHHEAAVAPSDITTVFAPLRHIERVRCRFACYNDGDTEIVSLTRLPCYLDAEDCPCNVTSNDTDCTFRVVSTESHLAITSRKWTTTLDKIFRE